MPKTRRRKKEALKRNAQSAPVVQTQRGSGQPATTTRITPRNRAILSPGMRGPQSLIFPGMVAVGCWGMAFSFFVFSRDPNHALFAAMAVLIALLWSFSFGMRLRKLLLLRQRS
jgi:hypothetical protein